MKACKMIADRNVDLRTAYGSINFEKGVARMVSPHMVHEALRIGVRMVDEKDLLKDEEDKPAEPSSPGARMPLIGEAIERIYERNNPNDFTTGATPKIAAVSKETGIKVSAMEVKTYLEHRNQKAFEERMKHDQAQKAKKAENGDNG